MKKAVYIHIPVCDHICKYCDFNKFHIKNQPIEAYLDAIDKELKTRAPGQAKTVFIGGGTPSTLSVNHLRKLLDVVKNNITIAPSIEYSIEVNPDDITLEKLQILQAFGVNRLSIGVQTFNDNLLESLGRSHSSSTAIESIKLAKELGFNNISIDLMYGLPNQTLEDVKRDLEVALTLDLQHISAYPLIVEPNTSFYIQNEKDNLDLPSESLGAEMYAFIMDTLGENGFKQYEISNYAQKKFESKHNMTYWNNEEYFGIGAGAHGYLDGIRYANQETMDKYITAIQNGDLPTLSEHRLTVREQMEDEMILGLRKNAGVGFIKFKKRFGIQMGQAFPMIVSNLIDMELVEVKVGSVRLTNNGRLIANDVCQMFIDP